MKYLIVISLFLSGCVFQPQAERAVLELIECREELISYKEQRNGDFAVHLDSIIVAKEMQLELVHMLEAMIDTLESSGINADSLIDKARREGL